LHMRPIPVTLWCCIPPTTPQMNLHTGQSRAAADVLAAVGRAPQRSTPATLQVEFIG
jgi:hypothetical protein